MHTIRYLEVRDRMTLIPVLAFKLGNGPYTLAADREQVRWLLARAGYGETDAVQGEYLVMVNLENFEAQRDPFKWSTRSRTIRAAHLWLSGHKVDNGKDVEARWKPLNEYRNGEVLDVRYIMGETDAPVESDHHAAVNGY